MKYRATFLAGAAVGYVLGARAGRERFEQMRRLARQVMQNPTVQEAAGVLRAQAADLAGTARSSLNDRVPDRLRRRPAADDRPPSWANESTRAY
jgi:hypothetical protein